jgi:hypothetical protein
MRDHLQNGDLSEGSRGYLDSSWMLLDHVPELGELAYPASSDGYLSDMK